MCDGNILSRAPEFKIGLVNDIVNELVLYVIVIVLTVA